jgi:hypothetical protein
MSLPDFAVHQEEDVVASGRLVRIGVVSVVIGATGVLVAGILLAVRVGAVTPSLAGPQGPRAAGRTISGVEQTPIRDARVGEDLRDAQRRDLETWGWVDRDAGIVRIPIGRAMDLVAKGTP